MTHCGLNSLTEGAYAGKPMIAMPLFADQDYNAAIAVQRKIGVYVDIQKITEKKVVDALNEILGNTKFAENAEKLKRKLLNHPSNPRELVRKWVEYAAEFGDLHEHLNLESIHMDTITYFCLDVIVPALIAVVAILFAALKLTIFLVRKMAVLARIGEAMGGKKKAE